MALRAYAQGRVFGERLGPGEPTVVALHGWGRDRSDFRAALSGTATLAVDLPGFGASPPPTEPMGAAGYAAALSAVLKELPGPVVVVGHSFGGRVAIALAAGHPDLVAGLVVVATPLVAGNGPRRPTSRYRLFRTLHRMGLLGARRMEEVRRRYGSADYRAATGVMREVLVRAVNETYEQQLTTLRCPLRLLWGADDEEVPVEVAERALAIVTAAGGEAQLRIVPGAGHHLCLSHPEVVRAEVEEALR